MPFWAHNSKSSTCELSQVLVLLSRHQQKHQHFLSERWYSAMVLCNRLILNSSEILPLLFHGVIIGGC